MPTADTPSTSAFSAYKRWVGSLPTPVYVVYFLVLMFVVLTLLDAILPAGDGIRWRDNLVSSVALGTGMLGAEAIAVRRYGAKAVYSGSPTHWPALLLYAGTMLAIALGLFWIADLLGLR